MKRFALSPLVFGALVLSLASGAPAFAQGDAASPPTDADPSPEEAEAAPEADEADAERSDAAEETEPEDDRASTTKKRTPRVAPPPSTSVDDEAAGDAPGPPRTKARLRDRRRIDFEDDAPSRVRPRSRPEPLPPEPSLLERIQPLPTAYTERSWRVRVRPTFTGWWNLDASLQPLREHPSVAVGGGSLEGEWTPLADLVVSAQVGYAGGLYESKLFQNLDTRMQLHAFSLGVGAGYRFFDVVTPYARVGTSVSLLEAVIGAGDESYGGWDLFTPGIYGYGGVELTLPRRLVPLRLLSPGIFVEAGYQHLGDFEPETPPDEEALAERRVSPLGTLHLGGPAFRLGLVFSF